MTKWLLILLLAYGAYAFYEKSHAAPAVTAPAAMVIADKAPYVAVYGRESCGFTQKMMADLRAAGIDYRFFSVDDKRVSMPLHERMQAKGLNPAYYLLPVVEVEGHMAVRPDAADVRIRYAQAHGPH